MQYHKNLKVDFTNCDKEPIQFVGNIQPHGFILIFDQNSWKVEQGSENIATFLDVEIEDLFGKELESIFPEDPSIVEQIKGHSVHCPQLLTLRDRQFIAFIHKSSEKIILECEPYQPFTEKEMVESGGIISSIQAQLNKFDSLESISGLIAESIQSILDYDRVLVFKFDQDWHAEVIAEKVKEGIHSFQGHHFPASDIPTPARALLEIKHIRQIPDVTALPVAIRPYQNPTTGSPIDILQSELRYPSEIHLEYLRNMNVFASVSFSVMVRGKLWGLVSCTNERPVLTTFHKRQLCDQVVKAYANILISSKEKRDYQQFQYLKQLEKKLIEPLLQSKDIVQGLSGEELNLLEITGCTGAAILLDQKVVTLGLTPDEKSILKIADWLSQNNSEAVFYTRELSASLPGAVHFQEKAAGVLALEISRFNKEYILCFKPEIKEKRIWAGNPEKPVLGEDRTIHPRKSFKRWEEMVKGKSQPWTTNELEIGQILQKDIVAVRLRDQNQNLKNLNEEYRQVAEGLKIKNKQLEDFAHIISHNLRSPLANIQGLYFLYQNAPAQVNPDLFISKVKGANDHMLATIDDLNEILKTGKSEQFQREKVHLPELIEKELQSLEATIIRKEAEVNLQLLATEVYTYKVYLESVLHNLLSNALKYSSPERKPKVVLRSWVEDKMFFLSILDNGAGIDLKKYGHKIFRIYQTFHQNTNSRGVGLYLTKMQVESLGGTIKVESEPGNGTTFTVSFPDASTDEAH